MQEVLTLFPISKAGQILRLCNLHLQSCPMAPKLTHMLPCLSPEYVPRTAVPSWAMSPGARVPTHKIVTAVPRKPATILRPLGLPQGRNLFPAATFPLRSLSTPPREVSHTLTKGPGGRSPTLRTWHLKVQRDVHPGWPRSAPLACVEPHFQTRESTCSPTVRQGRLTHRDKGQQAHSPLLLPNQTREN